MRFNFQDKFKRPYSVQIKNCEYECAIATFTIRLEDGNFITGQIKEAVREGVLVCFESIEKSYAIKMKYDNAVKEAFSTWNLNI